MTNTEFQRPRLRLFVEDVVVSKVFVVTVFDEDGAAVCSADSSFAGRAIELALSQLPELIDHGQYEITIEIMNPPDRG